MRLIPQTDYALRALKFAGANGEAFSTIGEIVA
jgi:hypothetical protein